MMIVRLCVIDPQPRDPRCDVIVYQVPEHSRAHELLVELLEKRKLEYVEIESKKPRRKKARDILNPEGAAKC